MEWGGKWDNCNSIINKYIKKKKKKKATAFKDDLVPVRKTDNLGKEGESFLNRVLLKKEKYKLKKVREC